MQVHKLDHNRSYGTIYGHDLAQYEQDGILYDGVGDPIDAERITSKQADSQDSLDIEDIVSRFIIDILSGGPMTQANVKRESEKLGLIWMDVETIAAKMNIEKYKSGIIMMWNLRPQ